ncbi:hypothetical protein P154DRAFT_582447 [Amniculicola lignicola CBS 123094]|uniref:Zn(2)-C6 fungal-type domain-containing protein n=1 Tax=Amniculicola lignicola CBS 123094 TaxID=1392246 RepID=A0A6A5W815_9PLEO|nr:hypothetical protein P154DRAFT_582447 [Amniculicola lignicola CBS 123094]
MRQRSGCKACRERHIKCVKLRDSEKCKYCSERKRPCIRGNAFRFRPVTSVKFNAGEDVGSAEQTLEFGKHQTWVDIPTSLRFVAPNMDGDGDDYVEPEEESEEVDEVSEQSGLSYPSLDEPSLSHGDVPINFAFPHRTSIHNSFHHRSDSHTSQDLFKPLHRTDSHASQDLPVLLDSPSNIAPYLPPINDVLSSGISPGHNTSNHHISPLQDLNISPFGSSTAFSPNSSLTLRWPVDNAYEARLLHHFIVHCTPWIDVCDNRFHFGKEVPKRAAHFPVIQNGVLGLAARHEWLLGKVPEDLSQPYIDQCLQALIVALEDPLAHWDENFLVAVILLRLHEEMGESDEQCHHLGTARILNSISSFAADGGLRESASWVSLRQHLYVSLCSQQPLHLNLDNYRHSSVFREFDDESWANRSIFLFALVLKNIFHDNENSLSREKWAELDAEVDEWERTKPWTFSALYTPENAGKEFNGAFPDLPTPAGVVAVGLQYYHLCKILLTIYSPHASLVGLAGVRTRKKTDASIRRHLRIVIGYGISNKHCGNAMFQGSHILAACGAYVVDKREQDACVDYLKTLQGSIGWRTDNVIRDLQEQWAN